MLKRILFLSVICTFLAACGGGSGSSGLTNNGAPQDQNDNQDQGDDNDGNDGNDGNSNDDTPTLGSAIVEWTIPSEREDGSDLALSDIDYYLVFYRRTNASELQQERVNNQNRNYLVIDDLEAGEYEVYVVTVDNDGLFSDYSDPAYTTIN